MANSSTLYGAHRVKYAYGHTYMACAMTPKKPLFEKNMRSGDNLKHKTILTFNYVIYLKRLNILYLSFNTIIVID